MLRMSEPFFLLSDTLKQIGLLYDTMHCCVEEQVAMFLHTIGHNERNTVISKNFKISEEIVCQALL